MDSRRLRRRVNPLLVDEQVRGGTVQGIGAVLLQGTGATLAKEPRIRAAYLGM